VKVLTNFASAFASSLVVAALDFIFFFGTPMLSAVLTFLWIGAVAFAFSMFKWRGFCFFLLGAPLVGYGFFVLYRMSSACAQNVKDCP
jgi:hypothetical protein